MASPLPIVSTGENLGQRHRQLNRLVNDLYQQGTSFASVKDLYETSALDHIFKIHLASKYKDVDYIIENLKHENMLYVSRALKSAWLLDAEYSDIINPEYLENVLYSEMTTTAVTKMKHWLELHLKDPNRCQNFYLFCLKRNFTTAVKFLQKCSKDFIMSEVSRENILEQLTPHHLKLLIEKCPDVATVFFRNLESSQKLLQNYLDKELKYYETFKHLLKVNGEFFLDITEKYFNMNKFSRFSPEATKYIMMNFKERFDKKPELYTYMLLDIKTLAKHLSIEEIKDLIVKLARATYLQHWFSYKNVEPLLKRLSVEERTTFKKLIFVEKAIGEMIEDWPYKIPSSPERNNLCADDNIFMDTEHNPREYLYVEESYRSGRMKKLMIKKKKGSFLQSDIVVCKRKSSLDQLFDRYRFMSFEKSLFNLRKQLNVETLQHRQNIMLVLISKSGGRFESLQELLKLLTERHINEPENFRATVIRSLVRRCSAWRMPQNVWELFLKFSWGIGLDGNTSTIACKEGIHAVIIRHILFDQEIDPAIWKSYIDEFSTLKEYSLNVTEKQKITTKLPELLLLAAEKEPRNEIDHIEKTLDVLDAYKIRPDKLPNLVAVISKTAQSNSKAALLHRLFCDRVARKELFKENFVVIQNDASYYNALKHDLSILATGDAFEDLIKANRDNTYTDSRHKLRHKRFLKTLALYFNEKDGLAAKYLEILKKYSNDESLIKNKVVRCIAVLSREELEKLINEFNDAPNKQNESRLLRQKHEWRVLGFKAFANRVLLCSTKDVDRKIEILITWRKTQKLALILSMRIGKEVQIVKYIAKKRPHFTLKTILKYAKSRKFDDEVWDLIISTIAQMDSTNFTIKDRLREVLFNVDLVPANKKAEYCVAVYELFLNQKVANWLQMGMLCYIERILPEIEQKFIETVVQRFLEEEFTHEKLKNANRYGTFNLYACLIMRISAKYLLLCKSDIEQHQKWDTFGKKFFDHFDAIWKTTSIKSDLIVYLDDFFLSLKYNRVFLDTKYVSCLPMFERIIKRLQNILPLHEYFEKYIRLHLTMNYFKSVRQSIKNNPDVFEELPKNLHAAAEIVGRIFGKLICHEVIELIDKYFESIIEIYKRDFRDYLNTSFGYSESKDIFIINVVRGILEHENHTVQLLAEHIYENDRFRWSEEVQQEIYDRLKVSKSMEVRFIFKAHREPY